VEFVAALFVVVGREFREFHEFHENDYCHLDVIGLK